MSIPGGLDTWWWVCGRGGCGRFIWVFGHFVVVFKLIFILFHLKGLLGIFVYFEFSLRIGDPHINFSPIYTNIGHQHLLMRLSLEILHKQVCAVFRIILSYMSKTYRSPVDILSTKLTYASQSLYVSIFQLFKILIIYSESTLYQYLPNKNMKI